MYLHRLYLSNFRNYPALELELSKGISLFVGSNGQGKTNLLEAIFYLITMRSFRSTSTEVLVSRSEISDKVALESTEAIVRGEVFISDRKLLIEALVKKDGRAVVHLNRQKVKRRDLLDLMPISVFMPDDLVLVKGSPSDRRRFLDDALVQINPHLETLKTDIDNILRQRNALLRQVKSKLSIEEETTLDIWDHKFAEVGEKLCEARRDLIFQLEPYICQSYQEIAAQNTKIHLEYQAKWNQGSLHEALAMVRHEDIRRGVTTVGPHRDELAIYIHNRPARTHASQGEQRLLALCLRLAVHRTLEEVTGESPLLLLDDVFSELDPTRTRGVLAALSAEQTFLTTAGDLPTGLKYNSYFRVAKGQISRER
ncbi:MAG: DNA replication/repair protein RecF [bacterium]|nr:DNA replication/repair protein RecF [bacterium]MCY4258194.1 DNA replication/repair protein RecF [bacterium]